jgi:hypothetical protein
VESLDAFLEKRAISPEVGGGGRYVRYEQGDDISSHFAGFNKKVLRLAETVAGQSGGFIINRRGWGSPSPPQLRPDDPVYTSNLKTLSYHPSDPNTKPILHKTEKREWLRVRPLPAGARERHLAKWHPDGNVEHLHSHRRAAKYVLPPGPHGKRLDVPDTERIRRAETVFFVIEGSLKTDAIRSQGEAAFGVPSVTLWDAPELDAFIGAMDLKSKTLVVIVPDADWCNNPLVVTQAILAREHLRRWGVRAIVAAPPWRRAALDEDGRQKECKCNVAKSGDGSGTVTSSPSGISCGASCNHSYNYGSAVNLTAQAGKGSMFADWSGACTGKATCTLALTAPRSVTATFLKDCLVPKVIGKTLKKAKRAIKAHDCTVGKVKHSTSTTVEKGHVISERPKPGKHLAHGAKIRLVIS